MFGDARLDLQFEKQTRLEKLMTLLVHESASEMMRYLVSSGSKITYLGFRPEDTATNEQELGLVFMRGRLIDARGIERPVAIRLWHYSEEMGECNKIMGRPFWKSSFQQATVSTVRQIGGLPG